MYQIFLLLLLGLFVQFKASAALVCPAAQPNQAWEDYAFGDGSANMNVATNPPTTMEYNTTYNNAATQATNDATNGPGNIQSMQTMVMRCNSISGTLVKDATWTKSPMGPMAACGVVYDRDRFVLTCTLSAWKNVICCVAGTIPTPTPTPSPTPTMTPIPTMTPTPTPTPTMTPIPTMTPTPMPSPPPDR